ncbi:hypothetical protein AB0I28_20615 [Phytomonospora sp. NPDC050363]|uniref:hypothetical protein n=1 Tax=Phytomonospora sp. NPDC050363 TaxID=3155642 RepID=UPI0033EAE753
MTNDIRSVVSRELEGEIPPSALTADGIVTAGRKRVLGRRLGIGGALVTGVAALAAGILVFQPATGGVATGASPEPSVSADAAPQVEEQPSFPLPDLDWNEGYSWTAASSGTGTPETEVLTDALWEWIAARGDVSLYRHDDAGDADVQITRDNLPPVGRSNVFLVGDAAGEPAAFSRPVYVFGDSSKRLRWVVDGVPDDSAIFLTLYPKDSYLQGAGSIDGVLPLKPDPRYLVAGCEDYRYDSQTHEGQLADFTCDERTGPGGERILTVECVLDADGDSTQKIVTALVYLPDGNAVVVNAEPIVGHQNTGTNPGQGTGQGTGPGPGLTADDMVDLALSMPPVIVK